MIKLIDMIQLVGVELTNFKIHCAMETESPPLDAFYAGEFKRWQEHQNQKNFQCSEILSLIHLQAHRWLFAGVYKVLGVQPGTWKADPCWEYDTRILPETEELAGRVVVGFEKRFRACYLRGSRYADEIGVLSIREERMAFEDFPGFNQVSLSFWRLKALIKQAHPSWMGALSNVSGVYLITDTTTGKHYVGSAYGGEGIWQRWTAYAQTGHGGNKELRRLLRAKGVAHAQQFHFSLLEMCDPNAGNEFVIERETHWKNVLKSREFGLNGN